MLTPDKTNLTPAKPNTSVPVMLPGVPQTPMVVAPPSGSASQNAAINSAVKKAVAALVKTSPLNKSIGSPTTVVIPLILVGGTGSTPGGVNDGTQNFSATASTLTYRPLTNPLTASDKGSLGSPPTGIATINVSAFTIRTSSKGDIPVNGGSVSGLNASQLYYVYYDDGKLAGGAVTYNATTTKETAINATGRFYVGSIVTPFPGAPLTTGNNDGGAGGQSGQTSTFLFGTSASTNNGEATMGSTINGYDGNLTTAMTMTLTSGNPAANATYTVSLAPPSSAPWSSLTLNVLTSVTNYVNGGGSHEAEVTVAYSLDGGSTFTTIYKQVNGVRALTTDTVVLPNTQNLALLQVRVTIDSNALLCSGLQSSFYEAWVTGTI